MVGDFNRDGNLDLVSVPGTGAGVFGIFLGNGDGTFKHLRNYNPRAFPLVSADFNGDGILDLALEGDGGYGIYVMLGNGDGTFQKPKKVISLKKHSLAGMFVTDFNGDGKADLACGERDQNNGKIWVALGNGDGTFKKPTSIPIKNGIYGFSFAVGDFNSDGKTDLVANYLVSDTESEFALFLGNGDGAFQPKKLVHIGGGPHEGDLGTVPADFNSDGLLDFIIQDPGQVVVVLQK